MIYKKLKRAVITFFMILVAFMVIIPYSVSAKSVKKDSIRTVRILAIGNSFSEDAIEQNLYELAKAEGINLIIGNLYHPGCSLEQHWEYLSGNKKEYQYRKIVDGVKKNYPDETLDYALKDEDWDYVSFQQASHFSGLPATYTPYLSLVVDYVRKHVRPETKFMWHMTWAYAEHSTNSGFKNYGSSQNAMYKAIIKTTRNTLKISHFDILIPSGTTVQNARTAPQVGDTMCRDTYHMQLVYGRYAVACTWFEAIFKHSVVGNTYAPTGMSESMKRIMQLAAHYACKHPFKVSSIK